MLRYYLQHIWNPRDIFFAQYLFQEYLFKGLYNPCSSRNLLLLDIIALIFSLRSFWIVFCKKLVLAKHFCASVLLSTIIKNIRCKQTTQLLRIFLHMNLYLSTYCFFILKMVNRAISRYQKIKNFSYDKSFLEKLQSFF